MKLTREEEERLERLLAPETRDQKPV